MEQSDVICAFHAMWDHFPEPVMLIKSSCLSDCHESEVTPESLYLSRRALLGGTAAALAVGSLPRWAAAAEGPLTEITGLIARPRPTDGEELRRRLDRFAALLPDSELRQGLQLAGMTVGAGGGRKTTYQEAEAPDWRM
mgnify:CR=1 FL=1